MRIRPLTSPLLRSTPPLRARLHISLHQSIPHTTNNSIRLRILDPENTLHNTQLRRSRIQPRKRTPIIHNQPRPNNITSPIHRSRNQRDLQQRGQLILILDRSFRVHETTLVGEGAVRTGEDVACDGLSEDFDAEDVGDDFLRLALDIGMYQCHVIITRDHVAQCTQPLLDPLQLYRIRQRVPQVLEFLVGCRGGDEEAFAVTGAETTDDAGATDGGVDYGEDIGEFAFEDGVEVFGAANCDEGVGVCEGGEDSDSVILRRTKEATNSLIRVLELSTSNRHDE
ncbi:hypothetical protein G7K_4276-t1 [Saitoella complicata NRRL Y-17804]|uniref:Uncharacterized protein n=1 Tax=Saitoella complicata (strain BCRC 22490 / CBS 7301 / JCM 7358 / NBRC 10748 / NRRL Y-17804) TaxID=698492 RepID=A0A0E9NKC6_SAICN|nr:hypothetical protein G7K_4276-t1 [Saitoella complicata NRRL Y-17804]